jgi:hypothetical protein
VRQVPARGEIETHEDVAGLRKRHEHRLVGLRARVGLHIGEAAVEQAAGALDGQLLGNVDELAAAVIAALRVALGVLVRQHRALCLEHRAGDDVLGGNELDLVLLAAELELDGASDLGIGIRESGREEAVGQMGRNGVARAHGYTSTSGHLGLGHRRSGAARFPRLRTVHPARARAFRVMTYDMLGRVLSSRTRGP